jgi:hypothetical protein
MRLGPHPQTLPLALTRSRRLKAVARSRAATSRAALGPQALPSIPPRHLGSARRMTVPKRYIGLHSVHMALISIASVCYEHNLVLGLARIETQIIIVIISFEVWKPFVENEFLLSWPFITECSKAGLLLAA